MHTQVRWRRKTCNFSLNLRMGSQSLSLSHSVSSLNQSLWGLSQSHQNTLESCNEGIPQSINGLVELLFDHLIEWRSWEIVSTNFLSCNIILPGTRATNLYEEISPQTSLVRSSAVQSSMQRQLYILYINWQHPPGAARPNTQSYVRWTAHAPGDRMETRSERIEVLWVKKVSLSTKSRR